MYGGSFRNFGLEPVGKAGYQRSIFGHFIHFIAGNPIMPFLSLVLTVAFVGWVFTYFGQNSKGVEFFVETEPEQAIVYVRARGNLSLTEKDGMVRQVEDVLLSFDEVESVFAFAGAGGINQNTGGAEAPSDTIGQAQIELVDWDTRRKGKIVLDEIDAALAEIPGIQAEISEQSRGPASGKPVNIRVSGDDWQDLLRSAEIVRTHLEKQEAARQRRRHNTPSGD